MISDLYCLCSVESETVCECEGGVYVVVDDDEE